MLNFSKDHVNFRLRHTCMYRNPIPNIKSIATLCNHFGFTWIPYVRNFILRDICQKLMVSEKQAKHFEDEIHRLRISYNFPFAIALIMYTAIMHHIRDRPTVGPI